MQLIGGNAAAPVTRVDPLVTKVNYFLGNDPAHWHTNVPTFAKVHYDDVYPGIDLVYYGTGSEFEYDFVVAPGADANQIALSFSGADAINIDGDGSLVVQAGSHEIRQQAPYIYQEINSTRQQVAGEFAIPNSTVVTFNVGAYDPSRPLVIDPVVLAYSTYLGGSAWDGAHEVAVGSDGSAVVGGETDSANFPVKNPVQGSYAGSTDAFIAKFNPAGTALVYATYLGGKFDSNCNAVGTDVALGVAIDHNGNAFISGYTGACNFPILGGFQTQLGGYLDGFIAKLNPTGSLVYSSFIGGPSANFASGVAVDGDGQAYLVGTTLSYEGFPIVNAIQPVFGGYGDYFVAKVSRDGRSLLFSTFLGGTWTEGEHSADGTISLDPFGNVCVTGYTQSFDFPLHNAYQSTNPIGHKGFVTKLTSDGSAFVFSTYLSGPANNHSTLPHGIATDTQGNVYVTGKTSSYDFPLQNPYQDHKVASWDGFITKFRADGSDLHYSTYLGGAGRKFSLRLP